MLEEFLDSKPLNVLKVFDHAHGVLGPVSFVQVLQTLAWEAFTFKTKACFGFLKDFTFFDFAAGTRNRCVNNNVSATYTFIFLPQIGHADTAVHSAGSDE